MDYTTDQTQTHCQRVSCDTCDRTYFVRYGQSTACPVCDSADPEDARRQRIAREVWEEFAETWTSCTLPREEIERRVYADHLESGHALRDICDRVEALWEQGE